MHRSVQPPLDSRHKQEYREGGTRRIGPGARPTRSAEELRALLRTYARTVALVLAALALAGATVLGWDPATGFYHAGLALLFGYVGFLAPNHGTVRLMVLGLGVLVLVTKTLMMVGFWVAFGHLAHDPIALTCYVVGVASVLASVYLPEGHDEDAW